MSEVFNVNQLLNDIKSNIQQKKASAKDEIAIMQAMLNDETFSVDVYTNNGVTSHCPATVFKSAIAGVVSETTKISKAEATDLMKDYTASKSVAESMITVSKDFFNTTLSTGRKINLPGTHNSDISITKELVPEMAKSYPTGEKDTEGKAIMKSKVVPAHEVLRCSSPCPKWVEK